MSTPPPPRSGRAIREPAFAKLKAWGADVDEASVDEESVGGFMNSGVRAAASRR